jgi:hypothetical protein
MIRKKAPDLIRGESRFREQMNRIWVLVARIERR